MEFRDMTNFSLEIGIQYPTGGPLHMQMLFHFALATYLSLFVVQNSWVYYRI